MIEKLQIELLAAVMAMAAALGFGYFAYSINGPQIAPALPSSQGMIWVPVELTEEQYCTPQELAEDNCVNPTLEQIFTRYNLPPNLWVDPREERGEEALTYRFDGQIVEVPIKVQ